MRIRLIVGAGAVALALAGGAAAGLVLGGPGAAAASAADAVSTGVNGLTAATDPALLLGASPSTGSSPATDPATDPAATCPDPAAQAKVAAYLQAHPDVAAELAALEALPADQRRAAAVAYLKAHPEVRDDLRALLVPAGLVFLAGHPDVAGLFAAVRSAPQGDKLAVGRQYVTDHPGVAAGLVPLRADVRACVTG